MRLNFELTEQQMKDLKALQKRTGSSSMKDLFNNAMTVLEWTVDETVRGHEIASINPEDKKYRVLVTPSLQRAAKQMQLEKA